MINSDISALIVASPGRGRDSLRALLRAIPRLEIIGQVDDAPSALKIVTDHHPALMLLDTSLPNDEAWNVLQQIKAKWSQTQCLVLVDTIRQQQLAEAASADGVLVKGFSIARFLTTTERLLSLQ